MSTFLQVAQDLAPRMRMDETVSAQRTLLNRFINAGLRRLMGESEWPFLVQRDFTVAISSGSRVLGLPSDFAEIVQVWLQDASETPNQHTMLTELQRPLPKQNWEALQGTEFTYSTVLDKPLYYTVEWLSGTPQLVLVPASDASYTLHLDYRMRLSDLSADADTNFFTVNYPHLVAHAALLEGGLEYLSETSKIPIMEAKYRDGLVRMMEQVFGLSSRPVSMTWDPAWHARTRVSA